MKPVAEIISFDGSLLRRGFWIYAWKITSAEKTMYYVGRTGDSSSCNAASPFNRVGTHLDLRSTAKANSLTRRLLEAGFKPESCHFQMAAYGPLFEEQRTFEEHKPIRDIMATLEFEVASALRRNDQMVIGTHNRGGHADPDLCRDVTDVLCKALRVGAA